MNTSNFTFTKDSIEKAYGVTFFKNEQILFATKPNLNAAMLNELKSIFNNLLISATALLVIVLMGKFVSPVIELNHAIFLLCCGLIVSVFTFINHIIKTKKTQIVITNLSIIIYTSGVNSTVNCIQLSAIQTLELTQTFFDKKFNTGSLKIFTGQIEKKIGKNEKVFDIINAIPAPEKAYSLLRHAGNSV
jgi:hypothetical protein